MDDLVKRAAQDLAKSSYAIALTGAGMSTESGIPDFRGPDGIWNKYDPEVYTNQKFMSEKRARKLHWDLLINAIEITGLTS